MFHARTGWRHQTSIVALCVGGLGGAQAAGTAPDAGQILPLLPGSQIKPTTPEPRVPLVVEPSATSLPTPTSDARVSVSRLKITSNTLFSETHLLDVLGDAAPARALSREFSFADLQALAARITAYYKAQGYLLAYAYLPAQDVLEGQVEIAVLEGRVSAVQLTNPSRHRDAAVRATLANIQLDAPLYNPVLERSLLLLSDLPGSTVQATLKPGASVGTSELDIEVRDQPGRGMLSGDTSIDNQGGHATGEYRVGVGINLSSPLHLGDTLDMRLLGAGKGFHYGRVAWQVPVGNDGLKLGLAGSSMDYRLQEDFAALQAHGSATTIGAYLLYPVIRSRFTNVNAQLSYDRTKTNDRTDSTGSRTTKALGVTQAGLSGSFYDGLGGLNVGVLNLVMGQLSVDSNDRGSYTKTGFQLGRTQRLSDAWQLRGQLSGQLAQRDLPSSEKFSLGGAQAVRAYPQGEAPTDDGWLMTLELGYLFAPQWQALLFRDEAQGKAEHALGTASGNERRLCGYGLGINFSGTAGLSLQASVAWRSTDAPASEADRVPRSWVRLVQAF